MTKHRDTEFLNYGKHDKAEPANFFVIFPLLQLAPVTFHPTLPKEEKA